jgi:DNA-binding response OmpR family regulator
MGDNKGRILCLENDTYTCELVTANLEPKGYEVIAAATIGEALGLFEKGGFDLLIVNEKLPDGRGVDFCRRVRESGSLTPVLMHAPALSKADIDAAIKAGADDYLIKPNGWRRLLETVDRLLNQTRSVGQ